MPFVPAIFACPAFEGDLEVTTPAVVVAVIQVVIEDARRNIKYEWIVFNNMWLKDIERGLGIYWFHVLVLCRSQENNTLTGKYRALPLIFINTSTFTLRRSNA